MTALAADTPIAFPPDWTALCNQILADNPFLDNRINRPSTVDGDVLAIHQAAFERLTSVAAKALQMGRGIGAVLWGEAGIGKSHLLSRLARWATHQAVFVYLHNLQVAPEAMPRSLLRAVLSILSRGRQRRSYLTPLFMLLHRAVVSLFPAGVRTVPWTRVRQAYDSWVESLGRHDLPGSVLLDRQVYDVFFQFFRSACEQKLSQGDGQVAALALRWLSGEALDSEEAVKLNLPPGNRPDEPVAILDQEQIRQVLVALTRLAACQQWPFVLALDQVDNLDTVQFAALTRFLEALIDAAPNLLVITAGIQATLLSWREARVVQDSAWDRIAQVEVGLIKILPDDAHLMLRTRLRAFLEPFLDQAAIAQALAADALFPLGSRWFEEVAKGAVEFRPRDVINRAAEGWRLLQEQLRTQGPAGLESRGGLMAQPQPPLTEAQLRDEVDRQVADALADQLAQCQRESQTLVPDEDRLMQRLGDLLDACREHVPAFGLKKLERPKGRGTAQPAHHLRVEQQHEDEAKPFLTGITASMAVNRVSVANCLRRLVAEVGQVDRQILITDARMGLPLGAQGDKYYQTLVQVGPRRFFRLELSLVEVAELDALHTLIARARSGDQEVTLGGEPRKLRAEEVIDSLHRQDRFRGSRALRAIVEPPVV